MKSNKGFSLVELIVVIAILGVLAAVLAPQYIIYLENSRIGTDEALLGELGRNMELLAAGNEKYGKGSYIAKVSETGYSIVPPTEGPNSADGSGLEEEIKALIPPAEFKLKSKEYTSKAEEITIIMTNGKIVPGSPEEDNEVPDPSASPTDNPG